MDYMYDKDADSAYRALKKRNIDMTSNSYIPSIAAKLDEIEMAVLERDEPKEFASVELFHIDEEIPEDLFS